jgi:hypothetical protein
MKRLLALDPQADGIFRYKDPADIGAMNVCWPQVCASPKTSR